MCGDEFRHADELFRRDAFRADVRVDRGVRHGGGDQVRAEDGGGLLVGTDGEGGSAVSGFISSGGQLGVAKGGRVTSMTIYDGAYAYISQGLGGGGYASFTTVSGGTVGLQVGGVMSQTIVSGGIAVGTLLVLAPKMPDHHMTFEKLAAGSGYVPISESFEAELVGTFSQHGNDVWLTGRKGGKIRVLVSEGTGLPKGSARVSGKMFADKANKEYPYLMKVERLEALKRD